MKSSKTPALGQTVMLEANPDTMAERVLPFPGQVPEEQPAYETVIGGPSVNLVDYYEAQRAVLGYFSKLNKGENFRARFRGAAGGDESDLAVQETQLRPRYGKGMNKKYDKSEQAKDRLDELAKGKFASALGFDEVVASGIKPKIVVDSMLQNAYDDFSSLYYGLSNKDRKNSYAGKLDRRIKKLKARPAAVPGDRTSLRVVDTDEHTLWSDLLDETGGLLASAPEDIDPDQEMTFISFVGQRGSALGKAELEEGVDVELHVRPEDFANIEPAALRKGLYIHRHDPRYRRVRKGDPEPTEQLAWAWGSLPVLPMSPKLVEGINLGETGVVMPAGEFNAIAHNPGAMNAFVKARTRDHNAGNPKIHEVNEKVGRSAGHTMESKLKKIDGVIPEIEQEIRMFQTIYRASAEGSETTFKAKEIEVLRTGAEQKLHVLVDTARLNLGIGPEQVKAMHRALTSRLHKQGSEQELAANWRIYASLGAQYAYARLIKTLQAKERCRDQLEIYTPYLERGEAAKAA